MNQRILTCSVILGMVLAVGAVHGNPTDVCPHWKWGETAGIYHYYSRYIDRTATPCAELGWDNYDGADNLEASGNCMQAGCLNLLRDASQKKTSPDAQKIADRDLKLGKKLKETEFPKVKNKDKIKTDFIYDVIVEAMIPSGKKIKVKLYLAKLTPKDSTEPPIVVANGFEVETNSNADFTVPDSAVERVEDHIYDIKVGSIVYRVIINTDP